MHRNHYYHLQVRWSVFLLKKTPILVRLGLRRHLPIQEHLELLTQLYPLDGGTAYYNLTISAATTTSFTLQATRTGVTTGDACVNFTFTRAGVKGLSNNTRSVAECW